MVRLIGSMVYRLLIVPVLFLFKLVWEIAKRINRMLEKIELVLVWPIAFTEKSVARYFEKKEHEEDETNKDEMNH